MSSAELKVVSASRTLGISIAKLMAVYAVVKHKNMTSAAKELHCEPASISRRFGEAESIYGQLATRSGKNISSITPLGYQIALEIEGMMLAAPNVFRLTTGDVSESIKSRTDSNDAIINAIKVLESAIL